MGRALTEDHLGLHPSARGASTHDVGAAPTKHIRRTPDTCWLKDRLGDQLLDAAALTTGRHVYRRRDGTGVVPLALLGP